MPAGLMRRVRFGGVWHEPSGPVRRVRFGGVWHEPSEPAEGSWDMAWSTQDFDAIYAWYEDNTGLSDPSSLGPETTSMVVSTHDGQVIEDLDIQSAGSGNRAIWVRHDNVTVRNCLISHFDRANGVAVSNDASGVVIEHNDFDAGLEEWVSDSGSICILSGGDTTIRRNHLAGYRAGMALTGDDITVVENYLARNYTGARPHWTMKGSGLTYRGTQGSGNVVIERNLINLTATRSSGTNLYAVDPIRNVVVRDNYYIGHGGGWGLVGGDTSHGSKESNENIRIEGNRFDGDFEWPDVLGEGTNAGVNMGRPGAVWTNNRWVGGTRDLAPRCGTRQDACH